MNFPPVSLPNCEPWSVKVHELERVSRDEAWNKSYRAIVETDDISDLLNPDFWPEGIGCRRYRKKRETTVSI